MTKLDYHRLRGSISTVVTMTSKVNGKTEILYSVALISAASNNVDKSISSTMITGHLTPLMWILRELGAENCFVAVYCTFCTFLIYPELSRNASMATQSVTISSHYLPWYSPRMLG